MPYGITQCYLPPGRGDISALTPAKAGTWLSDPGGMQGWVDLVNWLHTEMVYPPEDSHPSRYSPGPTCVNFVHATNSANHYATPPTKLCSDARNQDSVLMNTLAHPSTSSSLGITDPSFQHASPCLWIQLPASLHQPHTNLPGSNSPLPFSLPSTHHCHLSLEAENPSHST